jgi:hypothetical protein
VLRSWRGEWTAPNGRVRSTHRGVQSNWRRYGPCGVLFGTRYGYGSSGQDKVMRGGLGGLILENDCAKW